MNHYIQLSRSLLFFSGNRIWVHNLILISCGGNDSEYHGKTAAYLLLLTARGLVLCIAMSLDSELITSTEIRDQLWTQILISRKNSKVWRGVL